MAQVLHTDQIASWFSDYNMVFGATAINIIFRFNNHTVRRINATILYWSCYHMWCKNNSSSIVSLQGLHSFLWYLCTTCKAKYVFILCMLMDIGAIFPLRTLVTLYVSNLYREEQFALARELRMQCYKESDVRYPYFTRVHSAAYGNSIINHLYILS